MAYPKLWLTIAFLVVDSVTSSPVAQEREQSIGAGQLVAKCAPLPMYPVRASSRGIEGSATVRFDVDESGRVVPDSIIMTESVPDGMFNSSAIRAISRFRYEPFVIEGSPRAVKDVEYTFEYRVANQSVPDVDC